jgi:hypothetical protein
LTNKKFSGVASGARPIAAILWSLALFSAHIEAVQRPAVRDKASILCLADRAGDRNMARTLGLKAIARDATP